MHPQLSCLKGIILLETRESKGVILRILMIVSEQPADRQSKVDPFVWEQVRYLRKAGIDVSVFSYRGKKNPIHYLKAWLKVRTCHSLEHFDLVHAQFGQSGLLALPARLPIVVTFHGSDLQGIVGSNGCYTAMGSLSRLLCRYVARHAEEIILVSEHLAEYLPSNLPFHVIPGGIDLQVFRPMRQQYARSRLQLRSGKQLVLFVGDPSNPVKRYYLAQQAIAPLKNQYDVELVTVSGVPHEVVPLYMNACDALLLTSKHEGSPTVVKEALACNLPVVSVRVGDVSERIGNVGGCALCADDSAETISKDLAQVLEARNRIRGRESVLDLDEQVVVQRIIEVYRSASKNRN